MKRSFLQLIAALVLLSGSVFAQDAATQERLDRLSGQIEDLIAAQRAQQKHLEALAKDVENLREQMGRPSASYATVEDVKKLANALNEVDNKRIEESKRISAQLADLSKTLRLAAASSKPVRDTAEPPKKAEKGYTYTVQSGDTLSMIVQAYREKNIKVTIDSILKANPTLVPSKMKVGQEIWIPAP